MTPSVHFVIDDPSLLDRYGSQLGHAGRDEAVQALAGALSTSRAVPPGARLLVRGGDSPQLALACPPDADRRVQHQVRAVRSGCRTLRYVDWPTARTLTAALARRLRDELGAGVGELRYVPIPAGGRAVMWMLGRELASRRPADAASQGPDRPVVVVDDIALTGKRFAQAMAAIPQRPLVFAHLYSHPELRRIIAEEHPGVTCLAAADLTDRAPALLGEHVRDWRRDALAILSSPRYWVGMTEHVCFPWNEPDRGVLDRDAGTVEPAWSLVPSTKGRRPTAIPIDVLPEGTGRLRPAAGVVFVDIDGGVLVATDRHVRVVLRGAAAPMWRALVATGERSGIVRDLVDRFDVDETVAERDLDAVLADLFGQGLIAEHDAS